jgi:chromatin structure-remodeling complex subunit RSC1/2
VKPFPASSSTTASTSTSTTPADERDGGGVSSSTTITHQAPPTRDRTFVEEVNYKGWKLKLGDWVHLSNPDDPSKPIVCQVFKCWMSESDELM